MSATKKPQLERFKEAARESGADMTKEEFTRVIGKITKTNPEAADQEPASDQAGDDAA